MNQPVIFSFGPRLTFADSNYHEEYFNVNAAQTVASGLSQYDADAGVLSYGIGGTLVFPMTRNISAVLITNYGRLGRESSNSSLVEERGSANQITSGAFINYTF